MPDGLTWSVALAGGAAFGLVVFRGRFLAPSGSVVGGLFGVSLIGFGGRAWAVPAIVFFGLSSLLSKVGRKRKCMAERRYEKGGVRDAGQVLANGGVGWALLLLYAVWPLPVWYWGFLGAFAAAAADTWATEIGALFPVRPRLVTTGRPVPPGTSGGVSAYGMAGALAGATTIWLAAVLFAATGPAAVFGWMGFIAVVGSGLAGSLTDSLLGAAVQAQYIDPATQEPTERAVTNGVPNLLVRGWGWVHNDGVNWVCTLTGALIAALCA